jgi:hypothetical protein
MKISIVISSTLRGLARFRQNSDNKYIPVNIAFILNSTHNEAEALLRGMLENEAEKLSDRCPL